MRYFASAAIVAVLLANQAMASGFGNTLKDHGGFGPVTSSGPVTLKGPYTKPGSIEVNTIQNMIDRDRVVLGNAAYQAKHNINPANVQADLNHLLSICPACN